MFDWCYDFVRGREGEKSVNMIPFNIVVKVGLYRVSEFVINSNGNSHEMNCSLEMNNYVNRLVV